MGSLVVEVNSGTSAREEPASQMLEGKYCILSYFFCARVLSFLVYGQVLFARGVWGQDCAVYFASQLTEKSSLASQGSLPGTKLNGQCFN